MDSEREKYKSKHSTVAMSPEHKKRFARYCKQQKTEQKTVNEYLVDYAIYHNLNIHIPLPKTRKTDPVTQQDFDDFKSELRAELVKLLRNANGWEAERDVMIKRMDDRFELMARTKDESYNRMVKQWNDEYTKRLELEKQLAALTGRVNRGAV